MLAPLIFIAVYLLTREVGFFPRETQSGWVFLFEPALGLVAAAPLAFVLTLVACWVWRAR